MKKIITPLLIAAALFLLPACSEKFNIAAPYKNITVIYAMLDKSDTAHYVRIQKAFLDQNKSALTMAKESDSSFFSTISVRIDRVRILDGSISGSISLSRVDLNNEGYPKENGTFFNSPNYAYKFKEDLDASYIYRVVVTNTTSGEVDSAEAPVIDDKDNTVFHVGILGDDTGLNLAGLDFQSINPLAYFEIQGFYNAGDYNYKGATTPVGILQSFIRFNWYDSSLQDHSLTRRSYDMNLGYQNVNSNSFDYKVKNVDLYNAVSTGLGTPTNTNIVRLIDRCQIFVYAGTVDFSTYLLAASVQGTGLTGNEIEPTYTNIMGKNVLGLYTSRGMRSGAITITPVTVDSLISGSLTANARIVGTIYH